jgi:putative phosphoribosyl transferase
MDQDIMIKIGELELAGTLAFPPRATGFVIFVHGSGSSRRSPRNRHVAAMLQASGFATLLFDLLTVEEERADAADATLRLDVDVLAERLVAATDSILASGAARGLPIGYFGGGTGAAAALIAAARRPSRIAAVVSRGGRLDLAGTWLEEVRAPTLLIVGAKDDGVLQANREAATRMLAPHGIEIVPNASHLFEEPGALDAVSRLAAAWFLESFAQAPASLAAAR